jgi:hypothetical protein
MWREPVRPGCALTSTLASRSGVVEVRVSQKRIRALGSANAKPGCSQQNTVSTAHPTILKIFQKSFRIAIGILYSGSRLNQIVETVQHSLYCIAHSSLMILKELRVEQYQVQQ